MAFSPGPRSDPGTASKEDASKFVAVGATEEGDLLVAYLPEGGSLPLDTGKLKKPAGARWYHPRTGGWVEAEKAGDSPQTFEAPDRNDWILLITHKPPPRLRSLI